MRRVSGRGSCRHPGAVVVEVVRVGERLVAIGTVVVAAMFQVAPSDKIARMRPRCPGVFASLKNGRASSTFTPSLMFNGLSRLRKPAWRQARFLQACRMMSAMSEICVISQMPSSKAHNVDVIPSMFSFFKILWMWCMGPRVGPSDSRGYTSIPVSNGGWR